MEDGLIKELDTYLEEDYPDATNQTTMQSFTPDNTKDKDYMHSEKYRLLDRLKSLVKIISMHLLM